MIGARAEALTRLEPKGKVRLGAELWDAVAEAGAIAEGEAVIIEAAEGLPLKVRPEKR